MKIFLFVMAVLVILATVASAIVVYTLLDVITGSGDND